MKVNTILTTCFAIIAMALSLSCVKQTGKEVALEQTDFSNKAFVQVFNSSVGTLRNYVYVDGNAVNGAAMAYAASFPISSTPAYFAITSGFRAFLIRDTSSTILTQPPLSFAENFETGKSHTIFMYDTSTLVKQKTVINNIIIPGDTTARLRFANFTYNPVALPSGFDIFSVKLNANIFTNVQSTEVTEFIPCASALLDTFYIRLTGSTTNLQNFNPTPAPGAFVNIQATLNPTRKRSFTLIFRGGYRASTSTNATVRTLSTFANN